MISPKFTSAFNTEGPRSMNSERSSLSETIFLILNVVNVHVLNFTVFVVKDASTKRQLNHLSTEIRLMFGVFNYLYFVQRCELRSHQSVCHDSRTFTKEQKTPWNMFCDKEKCIYNGCQKKKRDVFLCNGI